VALVAILKDDTRRLFGEQVNDHIEKLNDLMNLSSGAAFDEGVIRRACLATRLLEGSTRMLSFDSWSSTLKALRELMERAAGSGRRWDEQLSQIISEVLETEEQLSAEILAGEIEEVGRSERFAGLERELEVLAGESDGGSAAEPFSIARPESAAEPSTTPRPTNEAAAISGAPAEAAACISTFSRLVESIGRVRDMYQEMLDKPGSDRLLKEIETAYGESEFFMRLGAESLRRMGRGRRAFQTRIGSGIVLEGLKDFFDTHAKLRRWSAQLATRSADITIDGEMASALASILTSCVFDICKRYEMRDDIALKIGVDVRGEGSYLVARIQDNAPDFLSDSEIDRDDAGAFYQCLREVRPRLESAGSILWLEPGGGNEGRFMFTLPRSRAKTDYLIFTASGKKFAAPRHAVDTTLDAASSGIARGEGCGAVMLSGARVPVFAIDELAAGDLEPEGVPDRILVVGSADRRVGLFMEGAGRVFEAVKEQIIDGSWGSLADGILNIGEEEFPIIDARSVMRAANALLGAEGGPQEPGSYADTNEMCEQAAAVPRA
jgi:hypothetical protein